jgi:hypothetical protein
MKAEMSETDQLKQEILRLGGTIAGLEVQVEHYKQQCEILENQFFALAKMMQETLSNIEHSLKERKP